MSLTHLAKGDALPLLQQGVLRLYSMKFCPYAQRTRIVLASKNIKHEVVNVNLMRKPEWLNEKNALRKVPILEQDDMVIIESDITCDYLDEVHPDPPLYPRDVVKKAQDRSLVNAFEFKVVHPLYKMIFKGIDGTETMQKVTSGLHIFEKELNKRGTPFFGGESMGMLDIMIWPFVERLPAMQVVSDNNIKIPSEEQPILRRWFHVMKDQPAVKESYLPPEAHLKYFMGVMAGDPKYDE